jgi:hypothetical protein
MTMTQTSDTHTLPTQHELVMAHLVFVRDKIPAKKYLYLDSIVPFIMRDGYSAEARIGKIFEAARELSEWGAEAIYSDLLSALLIARPRREQADIVSFLQVEVCVVHAPGVAQQHLWSMIGIMHAVNEAAAVRKFDDTVYAAVGEILNDFLGEYASNQHLLSKHLPGTFVKTLVRYCSEATSGHQQACMRVTKILSQLDLDNASSHPVGIEIVDKFCHQAFALVPWKGKLQMMHDAFVPSEP